MIKLSTGKNVPEIKDLTQMQMLQLIIVPIDREMPQDLKDYLQAVEDRFMGRDTTDRKIAQLEKEMVELTKEFK